MMHPQQIRTSVGPPIVIDHDGADDAYPVGMLVGEAYTPLSVEQATRLRDALTMAIAETEIEHA